MDTPPPSRPVEAADNYVYNQGTDRGHCPVAPQWSQQDNQNYRDAGNRSQSSDCLNNVSIEQPPPGGWQPVTELPSPPVVMDNVPPPVVYDYGNSYGNNYNSGYYNYNYPGAAFYGGVVGGIIGGELFGGRRDWGYSRPYFHESYRPMHSGRR